MYWIIAIVLFVVAAFFVIRWRLRRPRTIKVIPSSSIPFEADRQTKQLVQNLWHLDKPIREQAARAIKEKAGSLDAVLQYLCTVVTYGDDPSVNEGWLKGIGQTHKEPNTKHAAEALGIIADARTVICLVKLLERQTRVLPDGYFFSEESRCAAVEALAAISTPEAIDALIRAIGPDGPGGDDTRLAALWALCRSGEQRAVPSILWARRRICARTFTFMQEGFGNWAGDIDNYLKEKFGVNEKRIMEEGYPRDS
jgi:hypothetical protein